MKMLDGLHVGLRRLLAVSLVLSALALLWPDEVVTHSAGADMARPSRDVDLQSTSLSDSSKGIETRPAMVFTGAKTLDKADFDPFVGAQRTAEPIVQALSPPVAPPPAPEPTAPPLNYRYLGQMTDPAGKRFVYLASAEKELAVTAGSALDEGYVVESVDTEGVHLLYPPLNARLLIATPAEASPATP